MELNLPVLFVNFKTYEEATGKKAVSLAKAAEAAAFETGASIALVVQAVDLARVSAGVKLPVFVQHVDPVGFGSHTGHVLPEAVKQAGAFGAVLNHAENKKDNAFLEKAIARAKEVGLTVMACAEGLDRAKEIAAFSVKPDLIAVEPPELIGGDVSVSSAQPELITDSVGAVKEIASGIELITGAGIKSAGDVKKAIELGTKGVFVASGIVKAGNQARALRDLLKGLNQ